MRIVMREKSNGTHPSAQRTGFLRDGVNMFRSIPQHSAICPSDSANPLTERSDTTHRDDLRDTPLVQLDGGLYIRVPRPFPEFLGLALEPHGRVRFRHQQEESEVLCRCPSYLDVPCHPPVCVLVLSGKRDWGWVVQDHADGRTDGRTEGGVRMLGVFFFFDRMKGMFWSKSAHDKVL